LQVRWAKLQLGESPTAGGGVVGGGGFSAKKYWYCPRWLNKPV